MTIPATAFAVGSTEPPRAPNTLRMYSMRFCPFAARPLLVLQAKQIPCEIVNINLASKPEWYRRKFPSGKVPLLENDGVLLPESMVVSEYLDDVFPGRKLIPQDPYKKALDKVLLDSFTYSPIFKAYFNKDEYAVGFDEFWSNANVIEAEMKKRGQKFLGGDEAPGFVDLMIWPFFQQALGLTKIYPNLSIPSARFPKIAAWLDAMRATPEVQNYVNFDHLVEYMKLKIDGNINYDVGL